MPPKGFSDSWKFLCKEVFKGDEHRTLSKGEGRVSGQFVPSPRERARVRVRHAAFTLAEVLITLAIIGVVAALTLPTLMKTISDKVESNRKKVLTAKIVKGLNMLSTQDSGLNISYSNSEEFVRALSKYLKMTTICSKDNLKNCFAYDKIGYEANGSNKEVEISSIKTAQNLKLQNGEWLDLAGFVLADGTPFIVSWNNNCGSLNDDKGVSIVDPDRPLKDLPVQCLDGIYDKNGTNGPNKYGSDVTTWGSAKVGSSCVDEIGGVCITTAAFDPTPITKSECESLKSSLGISECYYDTDYWAGAVKQCGGVSKLPTEDQLIDIARVIYNNNSITTDTTYYGSPDSSKIPSSLTGLGSSWYDLWSGREKSAYSAYYRYFFSSNTGRDYYPRDTSHNRAVCVGD